MIGELSFIKTQLWVVIGLLLAILVGNVLCNLRREKAAEPQEKEPDLRTLYRLDKLDEVIAAAHDQLQAYPNSTDALYYGALALMAQRRYPEAHEYFRRHLELDPAMRENLRDYLEETAREPSS